MNLGKYSMGIGDRFGRQGEAQLAAMIQARDAGLDVTPVWNKSNREHEIIHTAPADVRVEADHATAQAGWDRPYFVDADHIGLHNVEAFIEPSDFFTLDVADMIGARADQDDLQAFVESHRNLVGPLPLPHIDTPLEITELLLRATAETFLLAVRHAGEIYRHIVAAKAGALFIAEVSIDEIDRPQTPAELFIILAAIADEGIPARTIAPKFTGRFNKGVDYVGDTARFADEFAQDLAVVARAVEHFDLPADLKLSVHSGSDKFAIYPAIRDALATFDAGLHLKTAGTTWLEELIGLARAGTDGLAIAKDIYSTALTRFDELAAPYATVIDIDPAHLPPAATVAAWTGDQYADALRHDPSCEAYNPHLRQLLHVAYKIAAEMGPRFTDALASCANTIAPGVTENILTRHLRPVFA